MISWLKRHPLAAFLPLQALLYLWNLSLLSPWMDEAGTLIMVGRPLPELLRFAAADVHPPLYYLLLFVWQRLPLGLDWAVQARTLTVLFALAGTLALDTLWARRFGERTRLAILALWTLSPCLLLYARMCRSYSLQALWAIVATAMLGQWMAKRTRRYGALLALALLGALYTHYAAGIALIAVANLALWRARRWRESAALDAAILAGYLPWIWQLAASLESWSHSARNYTLTGSSALEIPVKLAYWAVSFTMGEAAPDPMLVLGGALLIPLAAWLVWSGARRTPELAWIAGLLAAIGFIGVARWVSYPFVPARLLFVLPFFVMLIARGAESRGKAGGVAIAALLALSLCGIACYFGKAGFRNKQYPIPMHEIAQEILSHSTADDSVTLVDSTNSDPIAMEYELKGRPFLQTSRPGTQAAIDRALADPRIRTVWFLRNTHDVSPEQWNAHFDAELRTRMQASIHSYQPYTPLELALIRRPNAPRYFHELIEYHR
ncbi:MAG: rane protein-like protein [Candidatus Solibacter sp.]|nr:rane protein-like protein [Candidatus Solibacter sp.]